MTEKEVNSEGKRRCDIMKTGPTEYNIDKQEYSGNTDKYAVMMK